MLGRNILVSFIISKVCVSSKLIFANFVRIEICFAWRNENKSKYSDDKFKNYKKI